MIKIHLDTDIGGDPDDLCALAMLLKWPDIELTGITTVSDDNGKRVGYTKYILQLSGKENIPVKAGADISGDFYNPIPGFPNEKEFWPEPIASFPNSVDEALELLKDSIEQNAIIIGIGPYTNLYLLDKKYPRILDKAKLFLMGGYIYPPRDGYPQWRNEMDWNLQVDVNSAKYVLENANPTLIPLSVTLETALRRVYLQTLNESGSIGKILSKQAKALNGVYNNEEKIGKTCENVPDDILNFQYDPLACAIALGWNEEVVIENISLKFEIIDEQLFEKVDKSGKSTKIVTKVNGEKFNEFWLKTVTS